MDRVGEWLSQRVRLPVASSGAFSTSSRAGSVLDMHSWIAYGIRSVPQRYQPSTAWYRWTPGVSPMSTNAQVAAAVVAYLSTLWIGRELMKGRKPFKFALLFQIHNLLLSFGSGLLLALMLIEVLPIAYTHGIFFAICNPKSWTPRLETYYIVNYLFKYWELADTLFLVVKKKPLAFLHVYHHSATAVLCFTQLNGGTSISWVVISLNLLVHVIMYYYYWATAAGYKIWWKRYVTVLQISQFVIDLGMVYFGTYCHFAHKYGYPAVGDCAGSEFAALQGCAILSSYLLLFISFYRKTYKKTSQSRDIKAALANGKGVKGRSVTNGSVEQKPANGETAETMTRLGLASDALFDETCGPSGVLKAPRSGANTPATPGTPFTPSLRPNGGVSM